MGLCSLSQRARSAGQSSEMGGSEAEDSANQTDSVYASQSIAGCDHGYDKALVIEP